MVQTGSVARNSLKSYTSPIYNIEGSAEDRLRCPEQLEVLNFANLYYNIYKHLSQKRAYTELRQTVVCVRATFLIFYGMCMEEHTWEARQPHINGNVAQGCDLSFTYSTVM